MKAANQDQIKQHQDDPFLSTQKTQDWIKPNLKVAKTDLGRRNNSDAMQETDRASKSNFYREGNKKIQRLYFWRKRGFQKNWRPSFFQL